MKTLAALSIPQFYTLYGRILGDVGLAQRNRYYCGFCHTEFYVDHRPRPGIPGGSGLTDNRIICPCCGHENLNLAAKRDTGFIYDDGPGLPVPLPMEMKLEIRETKDCLSLWVREKAVYLEGRAPLRIWKRTEEFRYNLKTRRSQLIIRNAPALHEYDLYDIFHDKVYRYSLLTHVNARSLALFTDNGKGAWVLDKGRIQQVKGLLRTLRGEMQRKWKEQYGYGLGPLYVGAGQVYGMLLFPLINLAWRLQYPDGQNLPGTFSENSWVRSSYLMDRQITGKAVKAYLMPQESRDSVREVIRNFDLPDKPFIRQLLSHDLLAAPELKALLAITNDPHYITRILLASGRWKQKGKEVCYQPDEYGRWPGTKLLRLLKQFTQHWSLPSIVHLLEKDTTLLFDCESMLVRATPTQREAAYGLKLKNLHNWLVQALRTQPRPLPNINLEVPEAITHRLQMQLENGYLNFFVPDQSKELDLASDAFHNCVRTYRNRVRRGDCQIVLMTDDIGRMLACLEVRGDALIQAKLKYNQPVHRDTVINGAVRDWCRRAGLMIATADVNDKQYYLVPLERRAANE